MYMACVVICNTVSGGHLNPAITFAVWLTCDNKKAKISKMTAMVFAQVLGGFMGIAVGRMVRVDVLKTTPKLNTYYFPNYAYAVSPVDTVAPVDTGYAPELLFAELFGSFFYILVFLSLKYRTHLQDKTRDPVIHAAAMGVTLFAT